jgi:Fe-S-cluster containining protein
MADSSCIGIPLRIIALVQERNRLFEYPIEDLEAAIRDYGFQCMQCGRCCTRRINGHIFLLDNDTDTVRAMDTDALTPAPDPEFCDQHGTFYVSGYAVRMRDDADGSCWFLDDNRCRIYDKRFPVCRTYPHMLRRGAGDGGQAAWRTFSRVNGHGRYREAISDQECSALARAIREYENAVLSHQISFLETVHEYFTINTLWHDSEMYLRQVQEILSGKPTTVMVYHAGELEECTIRGERLFSDISSLTGAPVTVSL